MRLNKSFHKSILCMGMGLALGACSNKDVAGQSLSRLGQGMGLQNPQATPTPVPSGAPPPADNNAKVFMNNPVAVAKSSVAYTFSGFAAGSVAMSPDITKNFDQYLSDVAITGTTNGFLENTDIKILTDDNDGAAGKRAQADSSGKWIFSSAPGGNIDPDHKLGQLMAYYWINQEKLMAQAVLTNGWHPAGGGVNVYNHCYDANKGSSGVNAYWAGKAANMACMSYFHAWESAFDASVYAHEMGHANIDYATNSGITGANPNQSGTRCNTADGCAGAINEGQADVHAFLLFETPALGQFFLNSSSGFGDRNADNTATKTAAQAFAESGEIHHMGGVYNSAWWTLQKAIGLDSTKKIFLAHLERLNRNDTFKTALGQALAADQALVTNGVFTANHQQEIKAAFAVHGITP